VATLPDDVAEALEGADTIKVDAVVEEFMNKQPLKILYRDDFTEAVNQFVGKDDKHAVEFFVDDALKHHFRFISAQGDVGDEAKFEAALGASLEKMEQMRMSGQSRLGKGKRYKEKPDGWDSDVQGHWHTRPEAIEDVPPTSPEPATARRRTQPTSGVAFSDEDDNLLGSAPAATKQAPKKAAAPRATKRAAPAKKAPAASKAAPARKAPARGRKKAQPFVDSDEEEDQDDDVVMDDDDDEEPEPPKKPAARATRAAAKPRQTTLNFSQSQRASNRSQPQKVHEISDDDISDDAFETMPSRGNRR